MFLEGGRYEFRFDYGFADHCSVCGFLDDVGVLMWQSLALFAFLALILWFEWDQIQARDLDRQFQRFFGEKD